MDVFASRDYRAIVRGRIEAMPNKGYGQLTRLANHLGVNATLVSQILSGTKNFTEDQGHAAAEFFEFTEAETLYFLLLVQRERAGSHKLKTLLDRQISAQQKAAKNVRGRITTDLDLSDEEKAIFYSDWIYTAVHTLSSIPEFQTADAIKDHLNLPRARVQEVASWLIKVGLCVEQKGKLTIGPRKTFVPRESILAHRHHSNWRLKALERAHRNGESDFIFTAPFSISFSDFESIREDLVRLIDGIAKRVEGTTPEIMAVIGVDFFQFSKG